VISKSRMFKEVTKTWNPVVGCLHGCQYCWARALAKGRLKRIYGDFRPRFFFERLERTPRSGTVFVCDMGDMWGDWVPRRWIERVLDKAFLASNPNLTLLFLTKNPRRYEEFIQDLQGIENIVLGATIESNLNHRLSSAPAPRERFLAMKNIECERKFISIEPILDFTSDPFLRWISAIRPEFVYVGYDNYGHRLPEPSLEKTEKLIAELEKFTEVRRKTIRRAWWEAK